MHDYTGIEIRNILSEVGIANGDTLYCHSNIGLFGLINGYQSKEQVCEEFYNAIFDIIGQKGTLIVPTYTNSFSNNQIFDAKNTASKMGVFAEWVRLNSEGIRSLDPAYSVTAIGAKSNYYSDNIANNSLSEGSVFDRILTNNAKILCLNHPGCTFIHFVERELKVPYRFDKTFNGGQLIDGNIVNQNWTIWVRYLSDDKLIHSPTKFVKYIKNKSLAKFSNLGRGEILSISASKVFDAVRLGLDDDPWFLISADSGDDSVLIDKRYR